MRDHCRKRLKIRYKIMDAHKSYNILLGRPSLNAVNTIVSTPHLMMIFLLDVGNIITIHINQRTTRQCYMTNLRLQPQTRKEPLRSCTMWGLELRPKR